MWFRGAPKEPGLYEAMWPTQQPDVVRVVPGKGKDMGYLMACAWLPLDSRRPGEIDWKRAMKRAVRVEHTGYSRWRRLPDEEHKPNITPGAKKQLERINQGLPPLESGNDKYRWWENNVPGSPR